MTETAQRQIDTRALEMAAIARANSEKTLETLNKHIDNCARLQRAQLVAIIVLLVGMVGVLINLYVLPQRAAPADSHYSQQR
jgi:hypothetical protein